MRAERAFLYVAVFLCGAAVLVIELISARHLSPFYGTSLAVWTSVISVTLAALSAGYVAGGWLADRLVSRGRGAAGLAVILLAAAAGCGLMPLWGPPIMRSMQAAGLIGGVLLSTALLLLPALGPLGMVGPYAIRTLTTDVERAGRVAGRVFALSTVGSILAALLTGFYLAPTLGVRASCLAVAAVLALLAVAAPMIGPRRRPAAAAAVAAALSACLVPAATSLRRPVPVTIGQSRILQIVEGGSYGEIKIVDRPTPEGTQRVLMFDGLFQTGVYAETNASIYPYAHVIVAGLSVLPRDSNVVVLGVGGGVVCTMLDRMGYRVTAVDIDPRMPEAAREWFDMPGSVRVVLEDGRQFIQGLPDASVDAVVLDVFTGDREPVHLMTREAFEDCRRVVKPGGLLVLNPLMYTVGPRGRCYAGLVRTLHEAGLKPQAVGTGPTDEWRNILMFAHPDGRPWNKGFRRQPLLDLGVELGSIVLRDYYIALHFPVEPEVFADTPLYTDDRTSLDFLNQAWNHGLRRVMIDEVSQDVLLY